MFSNSTSPSSTDEAHVHYLNELKAEKEELEKSYSENSNAIKLLINGKLSALISLEKQKYLTN